MIFPTLLNNILVKNNFLLSLVITKYLETIEAELSVLFPTCDLLPGAETLIRHLHHHGVSMCVATSSDHKMLALKTESKHREIFSLFSHIVTGDDPAIAAAKPCPDIYNVARDRFPPGSDAQCLVFEDSPTGVTAALAANMQVREQVKLLYIKFY